MKRQNNLQKHDRREFIAKSGVAFAGLTILPSFVLGGKKHPAPSGKLNIAGIGVGGVGKGYLNGAHTENFVALCDVDKVLYHKMLTDERAIKGYQPDFLEKIKQASLGYIAVRTGKKLEWDGVTIKITNDEDANKLIKEPYYNGWKI